MYPVNQWGGAPPPSYAGYQHPQMAGGFMQPQQGTMGPAYAPGPQQAAFVPRPAAPPPPPMGMVRPMATGMPQSMMAQHTGMPAGMPQGMMAQHTGMPPPQGMMMQPTGLGAMSMGRGPMAHQTTGLAPQVTGITPQMTGMAPQMTGVLNDPRMRLMYTQFLPAPQPYSGAPMASSMNFNQASMQPAQFQTQLQNLTVEQQGTAKPKIPWTLSKEERKSYDNIFRAWDAKRTGFISGDVAREVFGQSGLEREKLLQVWHLADTENRGKLNLAEFHVAMALIYRALNGNEVPQELPAEIVPSSARDLSESVDFLKDLLKQDTSVRNATALNLPEPGSNRSAKHAEARSFYRNPVEPERKPSDAVAYKHNDGESAGYRSRSRYLDRREVRFDGQSAADDIGEMKRQLEKTQRMLERADVADEEDHELEREMDDVRYAIRRLQDDLEYYNRREGDHAADQRRRAERTLIQLLHERLPHLEQRLERRHTASHKQRLDASKQRDARNNNAHAHLDSQTQPDPSADGPEKSPPEPVRHTSSDASAAPEKPSTLPRASAAPSPAPSTPVLSSPVPPSPAPAPQAKLTGAEREAWIRSEAQRRVQERMRMLGVAGPVEETTRPVDTAVEERLKAEQKEAELRIAQADREAAARDEARRARIRDSGKTSGKNAPPPPGRLPRDGLLKGSPPKGNLQDDSMLQKEQSTREEPAHGGGARGQPTVPAWEPEPVQSSAPPAPASPAPAPPAPASPAFASPAPAPPAPASPEAASPAPAPPAPAPPAPAPPASALPASRTNPFFRAALADGQSTAPSSGPGTPARGVPEPSPSPTPPAPDAAFAVTPAAPAAPEPSTAALPSAPRSAAPAAAASRSRTVHLPPPHDEDWEDEEDEGEENVLSSRMGRQHLAQQLFSGMAPTSQTTSPATPGTPVVSSAPPPPAPAPPAAAAPRSAPAGESAAPADHNALLSQIRGGQALRRAQTCDRSAAAGVGAVLGSSSPPRGLSTSSVPPVDDDSDEGDAGPESADAGPYSSAQWSDTAAATTGDGVMVPGAFMEAPADGQAAAPANGQAETPADAAPPPGTSSTGATESELGFNMSRSLRFRSMFPFTGDSDDVLSFEANQILLVHPMLNGAVVEGDWTYGALLNAPEQKGLVPAAYVADMSQSARARALYDYEAASADEASLSEGESLEVVDQTDADWWLIARDDHCLLVPANYVELA
ncbi:hypothetical protein MSPP1_000779 [Malassezia sp. CBS 17886]|nr:hypothetical protein MSPP1_000779 [Malassezia sp. CBS 17886]